MIGPSTIGHACVIRTRVLSEHTRAIRTRMRYPNTARYPSTAAYRAVTVRERLERVDGRRRGGIFMRSPLAYLMSVSELGA